MKVSLSPDKRQWHPSVLPGQIVLVSTYDDRGAPNVAPKSWVSMVAFTGPMIAFGCNETHSTYQNILRTRAFVINIPDASLARRMWSLPDRHGADRIAQSGFVMAPARSVDAPLVAECRAHLECMYDDVKAYGDEVMIFGKIVAASADAGCLQGEVPAQYFHLRPVFFLEDGTYGALDVAHRVDAMPPTSLSLFMIEIGEPPEQGDAMQAVFRAHLDYLSGLQQRGQLSMAGAFAPGGAIAGVPPAHASGGLYMVSAASSEQAIAIAEQDPMVAAGASYTVRAWQRSF